jgi:hypothetical protein
MQAPGLRGINRASREWIPLGIKIICSVSSFTQLQGVHGAWSAPDGDGGRHQEHRWSVVMKKFFGILIIATGISFPAYAQSFDADNGTGNLISANTGIAAPVVTGSVTRNSGTEAYAMSARRKVNAEASYNAEPANHDGSTGGGSAGYNEMLRNW